MSDHRPTSNEPLPLSVSPAGETSPDSQATRPYVPAGESLAVPPPLRGDRPLPSVAGYEVLGVLGRGGMGVVYKARQIALKRVVALKMILAGSHAQPQELARFHLEAEAVARLQHPNIVQIYEIGEQEGLPFFSLEFVDGGSLAKMLAHTPQPGKAAAELTETLARAMHDAHQRGVVHRDLKPANVLLTEGGTPKITDFGLAKQLEGDSGQTRSGAIMGTPSYMAPEQAEGKIKQIGPLSDVYALGAILYEMLTGRPPFRGDTPMETLRQVLSQEPVPPARLQPKVHRDLETICLKALAKEPARRYPSALALAEDLARFRAGEPILAKAVAPWERLWRKLRRNRAAAGALLAVGLVIALATSLALTVSGKARQVAVLGQRIQAELDTPELTESYLTRVEAHIDELDRLAPDQAAAQRQRLHQRFADAFLQSLKNRTLQPEDVSRLKEALVHLGGRAPDAVPALRDALEKRLGQWQPVFDLAEPFAGWEAVLDPSLVQAEKGHLRQRPKPGARPNLAPLVSTRTPSQGNVRLEATFGDSWRAAPEIGLVLHATHGHSDLIVAVAASPDGRTLATASNDTTARLWDLATGEVRAAFEALPGAVRGVVFAPDGNTLAIVAGGIHFRDVGSGKERQVLKGPTANAIAVAFSPRGETLATGHWDGSVKLWDRAAGELRATLEGHGGQVNAVAFSPDGRTLGSASGDGTFRLWDLATRQGRTLVTEAAGMTPLRVAFSPGGKVLATLSSGVHNKMTLWDLATGHARPVGVRTANTENPMAFSPNGKKLAVVVGREVALCDPVTGEVERLLPEPLRTSPLAVTFSADGQRLFTGDDRGTIRVWDMPAGKPLGTFGNRNYAFLLRAPAAESRGDRDQAAPPGPTLDAVRRAGGSFRLEIRRDGALLRGGPIEAAALAEASLQLRVVREGNRLSFQVNDLPPLAFEETFGPGTAGAGVFALRWPVTARLDRLRAMQQILPLESSPLERGDALYVRGQYAEALAYYQDQAILAGAGEISQECRHKQGLCLLRLNRDDEAAKLFQRLGAEPGGHWPPRALCQLWVLRLRQPDLEGAEAIFETLRHRYRFEELAALLPDDLRTLILSTYVEQTRGLNFYRPDPERIARLERAARAEEFLSGLEGHNDVRWQLARAYRATGQADQALRLVEEVVRRASPDRSNIGNSSWLEEYAWLLRLRGEPKRALEEVDRWLWEKPGVYREDFLGLLLERARVHAALGQWDAAEKDLEDFSRLAPPGLRATPYYNDTACLLRGFLRERRGDAAGAARAWEEGVVPLAELDPLTGYEALSYMMLASLANKLPDAEAGKLLAKAATAGPTDTGPAGVLRLMQVPPSVLREMWRTRRGRESARQIAFREVSFADTLRLPALLLFSEWLHQGALPADLTAEQDTLLWQFAEDAYARYFAGKLGTAQLLPMSLTWKGTSGAFGWASVAPTLDPSFRGPLAYVLGHRYLRLKKPAEAAKLFRTALDDAPADSALRRLAQTELDKMKRM
jgi:WD40 repeat protein/tetratricopeptide (TPR) repeat protein